MPSPFLGLGGVAQAPSFGQQSALASRQDELHFLALRSQAAAGLAFRSPTIHPPPPKEKTFKDELQDDVDEWLSGINIKHG